MKISKAVYKGQADSLHYLCESITDCHHSTPLYTQSGRLVVRNYNVKDGRLVLDDSSFTDDEHFSQRTSRVKPQPGDLIITREAPMGEVCIIPEGVECCLGQRMVLIRPDDNKVDNRYLLYVLLSDYLQQQIFKSDGTGSIVSNLRIPVLESLKIPLSDPLDQKRIGEALGVIDEKISLNKNICKHLIEMIRLVYDYWFLQFDFPDENGRPYKSSGGEMEYNDFLKRDIPKGWCNRQLSEITTISTDSIKPANSPEKAFKLFSIPGFDANQTYTDELGAEIGSNKFTVRETDLLVSKLNPWFNRVIYPLDESDQICSTEFVVWRSDSDEIKNFLYATATSNQFITYSTYRSTGTSNSHKRVNPAVMMRFSFAYSENVSRKYGEKISPFIKQIILIQQQNHKLSAWRNWLLSNLMNGQVKVS